MIPADRFCALLVEARLGRSPSSNAKCKCGPSLAVGETTSGGSEHPRKGPNRMPVIALAGGSFIFLGVIVGLFLAIVYGYYTYRGSAINAHPSDGLDGAPGSEGPSQASGKGRTSEDSDDNVSAGGGFATHGTR